MGNAMQSAGFADLHVHTNYSDGADGVSDVLAWAAQIGLDVIAITDHDTIDGAFIAAELARVRNEPEVIVGEEVSSRDGHILALFIRTVVPPNMSAEETVEAIHEQGGLAIAAHPYWRTSDRDHRGRAFSLGDRIAEIRLDAVEVINGAFTPSIIGANFQAGPAAGTLGMTRVGGSDAHVRHALGWAHTRFDGRTADDLRHSIVNARTEAGRWGLHPTGVRRYATWSIGRLRLRTAGRSGRFYADERVTLRSSLPASFGPEPIAEPRERDRGWHRSQSPDLVWNDRGYRGQRSSAGEQAGRPARQDARPHRCDSEQETAEDIRHADDCVKRW